MQYVQQKKKRRKRYKETFGLGLLGIIASLIAISLNTGTNGITK